MFLFQQVGLVSLSLLVLLPVFSFLRTFPLTTSEHWNPLTSLRSSALVTYCYATNYHKAELVKISTYYLTVSLGQKFGSGSALLPWLRVSHEVAVRTVRMWWGLQSSEDLPETGEFPSIMVPSCAVGGKPQFLAMWASLRAAWMSSWHSRLAGFSQSEWIQRRWYRGLNIVYDLAFKVTLDRFCMSYWQHKSTLFNEEGDYKGHWKPGGRNQWWPSWRLVTISSSVPISSVQLVIKFQPHDILFSEFPQYFLDELLMWAYEVLPFLLD